MPNFKPGQSIGYVGANSDVVQGWRLVLSVDDTNYRVGEYYELRNPTEVASPAMALEVAFVDRSYRAVTGGGEENAPVDTARIEALEGRISTLQTSIERWRADANIVGEELLEEAGRRDWCSDYDSWVEGVNRRLHNFELPVRSRDFDVVFNISTTVTVTVNACDEDSAAEVASENLDLPRHIDGNYVDWDVETEEVNES